MHTDRRTDGQSNPRALAPEYSVTLENPLAVIKVGRLNYYFAPVNKSKQYLGGVASQANQ